MEMVYGLEIGCIVMRLNVCMRLEFKLIGQSNVWIDDVVMSRLCMVQEML